ncbi:MAG: metal-dependent hydrolase [Chloroflexota bacterium]|nr:metal-dependent hydrolase [Chloroflexota bacterium]
MPLDPNTTITWYGHACIEVTTPGGKTILIDPWFGNPKSPKAPAAVNKCDVMLVTHGHSDHFGDALAIASRTRPAWPAIHELSLWLGRNYAHKDSVIGMNKGGTVEAGGVRVTMTHADHSSGDIYGGVEAPLYLGEPVGFVIELESGYRIYHAGDTGLFGDLRLIGEVYRPNLAILPIGGHFTMGPREAAIAVEWLAVKDVLPIHYGTFPLLAGTPEELRKAVKDRALSDVTVHALEPGGRLG